MQILSNPISALNVSELWTFSSR